MITDNYIKMCEQAEEIQKLWKPEEGDNFAYIKVVPFRREKDKLIIEKIGNFGNSRYFSQWGFKNRKLYKEVYFSENWQSNEEYIGVIWLPTQEQLQGMYKQKWANGQTYLDYFYQWAKKQYNPFVLNREDISWNELWLAFVMHEKYHKIWTGEKWIKEVIK